MNTFGVNSKSKGRWLRPAARVFLLPWMAGFLIGAILITSVTIDPALAAGPWSVGGTYTTTQTNGMPMSTPTPQTEIIVLPSVSGTPTARPQAGSTPSPLPQVAVPVAPGLPAAANTTLSTLAPTQSVTQTSPTQASPFGIPHLAYSPDGSILALGTAFGIYLYDVPTSQPTGRIDTGGAVTAIAFSPDGKFLASGSFSNVVQIWQVSNGQLVRALETAAGMINAVVFSPDGALLAVASADGLIRLWNVTSGELIRSLSGHVGPVWSVAFAPNGQFLASGGADGSVRVWSLASGLSVASVVGAVGGVSRVAYSPDGSLIAFGSGDGIVRTWQPSTGKITFTLTGHKGGITDLAFSNDGALLASAAFDATVRLWQLANGRLLTILPVASGAVSSLAFQPNATQLMAISYAGQFQLWSLSNLQYAQGGLAAAFVPTPIVIPSPRPATCTDGAAFVADVTVPDNSVIQPGAPFNKVWRVQNTGTCTWNSSYRLVFVSGAQLGAVSSQALTTVAPGNTLDIGIGMTAPAQPGIYQGVWQLVNAAGRAFGPRLSVVIQVPVPVPPASLDISADSTNINAGSSVTIRATVNNVRAAWVNGDPVINNYYQKTFTLCNTTTFTLDVELPNGQHVTKSVTVNVNGSCPSGESSANLDIRKFSVSDSTPKVGTPVEFSVRIRNTGDKKAKHFDVQFRKNKSGSWDTVAADQSLDGNDEVTFKWKATYTNKGKHEAQVRVRFEGETADSASLTINVHT